MYGNLGCIYVCVCVCVCLLLFILYRIDTKQHMLFEKLCLSLNTYRDQFFDVNK